MDLHNSCHSLHQLQEFDLAEPPHYDVPDTTADRGDRVRLTICTDRCTVANNNISSLLSAAFIFLVDTAYYGRPTFTPLNFLKTNLSSVSLFYGSTPWHYYLTQAYPILLSSSLPFVFHGMTLWEDAKPSTRAVYHVLLGLTIWTTFVYSLAGHKEWRFLHPLLPIMHLFATRSLVSISRKKVAAKSSEEHKEVQVAVKRRYLLLLSLQIPAILYTTFAHGRAQMMVIHYLRSIPEEDLANGGVGFLMPCHSTPWMAYLHRPSLADSRAWSLGCEPPTGYVAAFFRIRGTLTLQSFLVVHQNPRSFQI